jgi:hypothetical protein
VLLFVIACVVFYCAQYVSKSLCDTLNVNSIIRATEGDIEINYKIGCNKSLLVSLKINSIDQ